MGLRCHRIGALETLQAGGRVGLGDGVDRCSLYGSVIASVIPLTSTHKDRYPGNPEPTELGMPAPLAYFS